MKTPVRFAAFLLLSVVGQIVLAADPPTKAQKQCILALQAAGAQVATVASNDAVRCLRDTAKGKLSPSVTAACLAAESKALQRAKAKTRAAATKSCREAPGFGPASADNVNAALATIINPTAIFGDNLAATLKSSKTDRAAANCQLALAQELGTYARTEIADYGRCAKNLLTKNKATSAADLEACVEADSTPRRKARAAAAKRVTAQCKGVAGATAFPGRCADASGADLDACLLAESHCHTCEAVNGADRLSAPGHQFKDGVATHYCGDRPQTTQSVARQWDEQILDAIRIDTPRPPVHARNLFHLSVAMYDAWAAYDAKAKPYLTTERPASANPARDRDIAVSFAAYRVLAERYSEKLALGFETSQQRFANQMHTLGLDPRHTATSGDGPAALGNRIAAAVIAHGLIDGANESTNYDDPTYQPVNKPLIVKQPDIDLTDPTDPAYLLDLNRWQPLALDKTVTQNGIPLPGKVQSFIGSQWGDVEPFAMTKAAPGDLYRDPGPQPRLGGADDAVFKAQVLEVIELASQLTPDDPTSIDISPASLGNNPLGSNAGKGHPVNPVTGQPYAPQTVLRGDFGRVLAEFWADGPTSETPPGHWNAIANAVADTPGFERRFAGIGTALEPLEWDIKTYFALNGAVHDAAIAGWGAKRKYDGVRPITMVRAMAKYGQSSDPLLPSYNPLGLPLKPGLVELITAETAAPGGRHAALVTAEAGGEVGNIAVLSWPGSPADIKAQYSGVRWVLGKAWVPYQRATFVTPAFPGYFSGHSVFSRSAAEVLAGITGSPYFPGGFHEGFAAKPNQYLIHERGPSQEIRLQWASYFDASDQAGRSRLWGGIHVEADDFTGRRVGREVGLAAFAKAVGYFDGTAVP
ncbi:vanadium-dependent haloperoxidase [Methylomagnum sp.]